MDGKTESGEYLVPDYFESFKCKMGDCRNACCRGWNVSISMKNYFDLLGVECSDELRRKIDCGMALSERRNEQEYAVLGCSYDGNCRLRASDGSCALQNELGEEMLPDICRLYPRGVRKSNGEYECSMANSCERIPEMFLEREEPIHFKKARLSLVHPEIPSPEHPIEAFGLESAVRQYLIGIIKDRTKRIPDRLMTLCNAVQNIEKAVAENNKAAVLDLIEGRTEVKYATSPSVTEGTVKNGLLAVESIMNEISERSFTIHDIVESILGKYKGVESLCDIYYRHRGKFELLFRNHETFFEHLLVNHMFFSTFPYQDRPLSLYDEFCALCAVYTTLRFLLIGSVDEIKSDADIVDVVSSAFRFIEHTDFESFAVRLMKKYKCDTPEVLSSLVAL